MILIYYKDCINFPIIVKYIYVCMQIHTPIESKLSVAIIYISESIWIKTPIQKSFICLAYA